MRIGVYKVDEYKITMGIEPTNDYIKAKKDIMQAMESIQKLPPIEQRRLAEEIMGSAQVEMLYEVFRRYWRS